MAADEATKDRSLEPHEACFLRRYPSVIPPTRRMFIETSLSSWYRPLLAPIATFTTYCMLHKTGYNIYDSRRLLHSSTLPVEDSSCPRLKPIQIFPFLSRSVSSISTFVCYNVRFVTLCSLYPIDIFDITTLRWRGLVRRKGEKGRGKKESLVVDSSPVSWHRVHVHNL